MPRCIAFWLMLFFIVILMPAMHVLGQERDGMHHDASQGYIVTRVQSPQNLAQQLNEEELHVFRTEVLNKVNQLQSQLSKIVSRSESPVSKNIYKRQTLRMFINDGNGVTMEVSSVNTNRVREYEMPIYLERLSKMRQYSDVVMKSAEAFEISDFKPAGVDENGLQIYEASATIYQEFIGLNERGDVVYKDYTTKTFFIRLKAVPTVLSEQGHRWAALLGDIKVAGTFPVAPGQ